MYKKRKQMVLQLMEFFDLNIPVNKKIRELSFLEQVEIQLLHAVGRHNKIIIVCGVNGKLNLEELEELERFYTQELEESFAMGFKTGARLMCEIFSEETE